MGPILQMMVGNERRKECRKKGKTVVSYLLDASKTNCLVDPNMWKKLPWKWQILTAHWMSSLCRDGCNSHSMLIPCIKVKGSASFWCHTSHACFKSDFKIDCSVDQLNWRYNSSIIPLIFSILVKCCSFEPSYPVLEEENVIQFKTLIKASEMLVAPRISECFDLL